MHAQEKASGKDLEWMSGTGLDHRTYLPGGRKRFIPDVCIATDIQEPLITVKEAFPQGRDNILRRREPNGHRFHTGRHCR